MAASSIESAMRASGDSDRVHATTAPSKQPATGDSQQRPDPIVNMAASVTHSSLGREAEKSWVPSGRSGRLGGASETSPA